MVAQWRQAAHVARPRRSPFRTNIRLSVDGFPFFSLSLFSFERVQHALASLVPPVVNFPITLGKIGGWPRGEGGRNLN